MCILFVIVTPVVRLRTFALLLPHGALTAAAMRGRHARYLLLLLGLLVALVHYAHNLRAPDEAPSALTLRASSPASPPALAAPAPAPAPAAAAAALPPPPPPSLPLPPARQLPLVAAPAAAPAPPPPPPPLRFMRPGECCPRDALHVAFVATTPSLLQRAFRVLRDLARLPGSAAAPLVVHLLGAPAVLGEALFATRLPPAPGAAPSVPFPAAYSYLDVASALATPGLGRLCAEFANAGNACLYLLKPYLYALLPAAVEAVLVLDVDLRVLSGSGGGSASPLRDVAGAGALAALRRSGAVLALARELQPTYTRIGMAQGFNGGVQLLDLRAQRASAAYTGFLAAFSFAALHARFRHNLDLGDQTLYSVLNETLPALVGELPCGWNYNLCQYWRGSSSGGGGGGGGGGAGLLDCAPGAVRVLHGNGKEYEKWGLEGLEEEGLRGVVEAAQAQARAAAAA